MREVLGDPALLLALVTLVGWVALGAWLAAGNRKLEFLRDEPPPPGKGLPPLSVVVPARNEAEDLEPALRSVLAQDYRPMEVVAVDDRSTDGTGEILERLARRHDTLRVLHVEALPDGWLGKNHACSTGTF